MADNTEYEIPVGELPEELTEDDIEIVDDTPEEDRDRTPLPPETEDETREREQELEAVDVGVRKRINQLTHRWHDERRAREAAEKQNNEALRIAQAIAAENQQLKQTLTWGQQQFLANNKEKINVSEKYAEDQFRKAHESGDTETFLAAQKALYGIQAERDRLLQLEEQWQAPQPALQPAQVPVYNQPNVVEAQPQPQQDPKAVAWAANNSWFGVDPVMTSLAYGLHTDLVNKGVDPQSDDYYAAIDRTVRKAFPERFGQKPRAAQGASPVAPASRATASRKVTLNPHQVQIAQRLGVPLTEYARQVAKLEKQNG